MELLRLIKIVKTFLFKTHSVSLNRKRLMKENLKRIIAWENKHHDS